MKKIVKRIFLALSLALSVIGLCSFMMACGEENTQYTVTVVYADGSPVDGTQGKNGEQIEVQICYYTLTGVNKGCSPTMYYVGSDGKVVISSWPELAQNLQYHIQLNNVPEGYDYDANQTYLTEPANLMITLTAVS